MLGCNHVEINRGPPANQVPRQHRGSNTYAAQPYLWRILGNSVQDVKGECSNRGYRGPLGPHNLLLGMGGIDMKASSRDLWYSYKLVTSWQYVKLRSSGCLLACRSVEVHYIILMPRTKYFVSIALYPES